ncbi:unnamed protein product [Brassica oleracea]
MRTHHLQDNINDAPLGNRKSKRAKVVPRTPVGEYQCDKRFLTRAWKAYVTAICTAPVGDYPAKSALLSEKISSSFVIDFGSLTLDSSEMSILVDRSSHLSAKVLMFSSITHVRCFCPILNTYSPRTLYSSTQSLFYSLLSHLPSLARH